MVAGEARLNDMDECDSESVVHAEYISQLTYTRSWLKVGRNRVLLTLFSAFWNHPDHLTQQLSIEGMKKCLRGMFEVTQET